MPVYAYKAIDGDAAPIDGVFTADTARGARDALRSRGLTIESLREVRQQPTRRRAWVDRLSASRRAEVVTGFSRQLAALTAVGVGLTDAVATVTRQHKGRFEAVLKDVVERVTGGQSLADALAAHPAWFDAVFVAVVRVGQAGGELDVCLARLAEFRSGDARLRRRLTNALAYPMFVAALSVAVVMFLTAFVVPKLATVLAAAGQALPLSTRTLLTAGTLLQTWWPAVLVGGLAAGLAGRAAVRTDRGELLWHRLLFKLPVVGVLMQKSAVARFASLLTTLLESGVPFLDALAVVKQTVGNRLVRDAVTQAQTAIAAGSDIAGPLSRSGAFDPVVVQMLATGEQSGQMEQMLGQVASTYADEVQLAATRAVTVLEPVLIMIMATVVGAVLYAVLLPILRMGNIL